MLKNKTIILLNLAEDCDFGQLGGIERYSVRFCRIIVNYLLSCRAKMKQVLKYNVVLSLIADVASKKRLIKLKQNSLINKIRACYLYGKKLKKYMYIEVLSLNTAVWYFKTVVTLKKEEN